MNKIIKNKKDASLTLLMSDIIKKGLQKINNDDL
jgi:hypothetical protein